MQKYIFTENTEKKSQKIKLMKIEYEVLLYFSLKIVLKAIKA